MVEQRRRDGHRWVELQRWIQVLCSLVDYARAVMSRSLSGRLSGQSEGGVGRHSSEVMAHVLSIHPCPEADRCREVGHGCPGSEGMTVSINGRRDAAARELATSKFQDGHLGIVVVYSLVTNSISSFALLSPACVLIPCRVSLFV